MIAKAVANNLAEKISEKRGEKIKGYFLNIKGPELLNKYVGETERKIREIFQKATAKGNEDVPVVVFFDEMDALFRTRGTGLSSDVETTIVPQPLAEIDGVEGLKNVIVIGASNRQDLIDPAILRPGRLDVKIKIERPDRGAATDIFQKYLTADVPIAEAEMRGTVGATIEGMITAAVEAMYALSEENRFLEVTYANGDKEVLYFKDFSSGAMIESIVRRAKKLALKRLIGGGPKGISTEDLKTAVREEFKENEDLPNTTNPDDWAKIAGKKGERIVYGKPLMGESKEEQRSDARGFEYMEEKEGTSKEESRLINLILSNGARFYVDHAHPEYSSPETTNPRDLVIWDRAGERILNLSRQRAEAVSPPEQRILIYKNNTDGKGNSYGTHENYLMDRKVPFARIVQHMMPFFVTRQIFTGAGKVGAENNADPCDYQISQRADFLETEVGLETMHSRPIINTRDEPHADPEKYRRLHVIVGDANMAEISTYLKVGTTAIVLSMVEDDFIDRDLSVDQPVQAFRKVSRDLACRDTVRLKDGRTISAVDHQREFLALAKRYFKERQQPEPWVADVMGRWETTLDHLAEDPRQLGRELDWVIKRQLIENYVAKHDLECSYHCELMTVIQTL